MEDYKEKYEEALERCREFYNKLGNAQLKKEIEEIFPELGESEDERIRKALINVFASHKDYESFYGASYKEMIAWLEKQGENQYDEGTFINVDEARDDFMNEVYRVLDADTTNDRANQIIQAFDSLPTVVIKKQSEQKSDKIIERARTEKQKVLLTETEGDAHIDWDCRSLQDAKLLLEHRLKYIDSQFEKQGGKKPTDKIEPKFKVGDWIVYKENVYKIYNISLKKYYECIRIDGIVCTFDFEYIDSKSHLWTIQDVQNGDVLAAKIDEEPNDFIYIFKEYDQNLGFWSHCYLDAHTNKFYKGSYHNNWNVGVPATKEQRELLFFKMNEAGYEWDDKNKKLKQIEQKASIDFSDLKTWKYIIDAVLTKEHGIGQYLDNGRTEIMAKELQERFGNIMQNPAWSEEHISVIERDGEQCVRVCACDEDFIIAAHDYKEGDKTEFTWEESCKIGTFSKKQAYIILALLDEINAKLEEIGGEPLDSDYWSSSEYYQVYAWFVNFNSGIVGNNGKYNSNAARRVIAF